MSKSIFYFGLIFIFIEKGYISSFIVISTRGKPQLVKNNFKQILFASNFLKSFDYLIWVLLL